MSSPQEQFSAIYDQYIEKIYRFVYLKVNSREVAEDITSRVFLKGWEAYQKDQKIKNVGAFLYQIARNDVISHYRQKGRTNAMMANPPGDFADHRTDIHEKAVLNADMEMVKSAILGIKKEYQDVIILHYLEDMPTEQIAEILGRPAGTVRVMIHRGLESLKNELKHLSA